MLYDFSVFVEMQLGELLGLAWHLASTLLMKSTTQCNSTSLCIVSYLVYTFVLFVLHGITIVQRYCNLCMAVLDTLNVFMTVPFVRHVICGRVIAIIYGSTGCL